MADTAIAVTAGAGTNIDTRTEGTNGNHRQVVVLGDPATNSGVAPVDASNGLSVTLTTALPAGTNGIGKLTSNAGVTIGAVELAAAQTLGTVTNVGTVSTVTTVGAVTAISNALPAGTNNIGKFKITNDAGTVIDPIPAVAHDAVDAGEPNKIGFKAIAGQSTLTLVAAGDRTDGFAGTDGVQITRPHCGLEDIVTGAASNTDGTSTQVLAAGAAGIKHYLTHVTLTNTSASNLMVEIKDGTTTKLYLPVPANSGCVLNLSVPLAGTAATAWNFDGSASATTLYCSVIGFKSKV